MLKIQKYVKNSKLNFKYKKYVKNLNSKNTLQDY